MTYFSEIDAQRARKEFLQVNLVPRVYFAFKLKTLGTRLFTCACTMLVRGDTNEPRWRTDLKKRMELDEDGIEIPKPTEPCSGLRKALKECILTSDCVKKVNLN